MFQCQPRKVLRLTDYSGIAICAAVQKSLHDITQVFVLFEMSRKRVPHRSSSDNEDVPAVFPANHATLNDLAFPEAPGGQRDRVQHASDPDDKPGN